MLIDKGRERGKDRSKLRSTMAFDALKRMGNRDSGNTICNGVRGDRRDGEKPEELVGT